MLIARSVDGVHPIASVHLHELNKIWQHPWLMAHRITLHNVLKQCALSPDGPAPGIPLHTSHRVTSVDTSTGTICFENGNTATGDIILGADGVHSVTRRFLPGAENIRPFSSGKSAYRFLLNREDVLANPLTKPYAEKDGHLRAWFGRDRRVISYPTNYDTLLNFAALFPDSRELTEEEGKGKGKGGWGTKGSREELLRIYEGWGEPVRAMLAMANEASLKAPDEGSSKSDEGTLSIWRLWDMETLKSWTHGKLALLGDAAHPFTPHQGQGGAVAIEDAAALGVLLSRGMRKDEVEDRLKLYEKVRMERAHTIQEFSRVLGRDLGDDGKKADTYNMTFDEVDNSTHQLRKWMLQRNPGARELLAPSSYGPLPGPLPEMSGEYKFTTSSIRFSSSSTLLNNFFPLTNSSYQITTPGTVCEAIFSCTTYKYTDDVTYSQFGLYIPDVEYVKKDGQVEKGTYVPIVFAAHASAGRENTVIDIIQTEAYYCIDLGDEGRQLAGFWIGDYKEISPEDKDQPKNESLLCHRYEEGKKDMTGYARKEWNTTSRS
ncbi:salicylate hydroxylase protein [Rutstroemia sp. NJR-2017a BBW]|nr:salicylate hydroxylase protein [Rutstroemia sp. NJR-2017a BBW]